MQSFAMLLILVLFLSLQLLLQYLMQGFETCNTVQIGLDMCIKEREF